MKSYLNILLAFIFHIAVSQSDEEILRDQILSYIQSIDATAELQGWEDADTLLEKTWDENLFFDKSGKLKNCVIFYGQIDIEGEGYTEVGIYKKDGTTKWVSTPVIGSNIGSVLSIRDLNRDGDPEIVTDWTMGASGAVSHIWIISWNGSSGKFLNDYDTTHDFSDITAEVGSFDIEDINSDGIQELVGDGYTAKKVFVWNGQKYVESTNPLPPEREEFGAANNFSISLKCNVGTSPSLFRYSYSMENSISSTQGIDHLYIKCDSSSLTSTTPAKWEFHFMSKESLAIFAPSINGAVLVPGNTVERLTLISIGPPTIAKFYTQGPHRIPLFKPEDIQNHVQDFINDIYKNSVQGYTISPKVWSPTTNAIVLLDNLFSYTRQSVSLGWLKSGRDNDCDGDERPQDGVSKNLEKRLSKVRTELTKGNDLKATKELEKFIEKVERISKRSEVMTSEAYALLKYNAEYLLGRIITLPARPTGTVLQQIDELKAELIRQQSKKSIGGVLLVKSLTFLADQAKKQLQKPLPSTNDSAAAALSIAAFQLVVDEIWESTEILTKKNKKFLALYVYDEAYIQLHYRAKYILEALPAPRTLIDMKSVEMDDDVRKELDAMQKMSKAQ